MQQDKKFVEGIRVQNPHPKAPQFVKMEFGVNVNDHINWLKEHANDRGWVNYTLKKSSKGKFYLELNTFEPKKKETTQDEVTTNDLPTIDANAEAQLASESERDPF